MQNENKNEKSALPATWQLPQIFHDRLGKHAGAQRAMFHDGHLLLILHEVPEPGRPERQGLLFWRDPEGTWKSTLGGGFYRVVQLLDRYAKNIDALEEQVSRANDAATLFDVLRRGSPLRRSVQNLKRALQQSREAIGGRDVIAERDRSEEMVLACELLLTDAKNALDYTMAEQAEAQSRADRELAANAVRLNRLAALFLPLTLLASLFGMNLPSGLETTSPVAFWVVLGGGLGVGLLLGRIAGGRKPPELPEAGDDQRPPRTRLARPA